MIWHFIQTIFNTISHSAFATAFTQHKPLKPATKVKKAFSPLLSFPTLPCLPPEHPSSRLQRLLLCQISASGVSYQNSSYCLPLPLAAVVVSWIFYRIFYLNLVYFDSTSWLKSESVEIKYRRPKLIGSSNGCYFLR